MKTQIKPISFAEFILNSGELKKTNTSYTGQYSINGQPYLRSFTYEDIEHVDMRLPTVIEALLASKYGDRTNGSVFTKPLLLSLHHWNNPVPILSTDKKRHYLVRVTGVSATSSLSKSLKLWANAYTDVALADGVPFVVNSRVMAFEVAKSELDRHFPGWQTRYQVMQDLQTDSIETLQLVFARPVKDVVHENTFDMSTISFD